MRSILGIILLFISATASAVEVGSCIRSGDSIVCNLGCRAFNMAMFNELWPVGTFTFGQLGVIAAASQRDLTPAEIAICNDTPPPPPPGCKVHDNGNYDRPTHVYDAGMLTKHPTARAVVGEPCGDLVLPVYNSTTLGYRRLARDEGLVAVCECK